MRLEKIKKQAGKLSIPELRDLASWIELRLQELEDLEKQAIPPKKGTEIVQEEQRDSITYRLEGIKCGKPNCKCAKGQLHGPYWYAYSREAGRVKSKYIGKKLPQEEDCEDSDQAVSPAQAEWPS